MGKHEVMTALTVQLNLQLRLRLLQPVRHAHLAVHRRRGREVLLRLLTLARTPVELTEAEVAVGDDGDDVLAGEGRGGAEAVGMSGFQFDDCYFREP
jgi:hypothetical protein